MCQTVILDAFKIKHLTFHFSSDKVSCFWHFFFSVLLFLLFFVQEYPITLIVQSQSLQMHMLNHELNFTNKLINNMNDNNNFKEQAFY